MQPVWQVLAPIDLLTDPEGPVEHAISISSALGAELTLLYVSRQRGFRRPADVVGLETHLMRHGQNALSTA